MDELVAWLSDSLIAKHIYTAVLGLVRLIVFVGFAPFFGVSTMPAISMPLAVALYIPVHMYLFSFSASLPDIGTWPSILHLLLLMCKEGLIGFVLAFLCMTVFFAVVSGGTIIDNQRGASMAQGSDPLSGAESSPLGIALYLVFVVLFFASGAFMHLINLVYTTYVVWSPFEFLPSLINANLSVFSMQQLDKLIYHAFMLCAPFILVTLMSDIALGLMNRFAPQLNVFVLSMPIKSGICAFLIILYVNPFMNFTQSLFVDMFESFNLILRTLGHSVPAS